MSARKPDGAFGWKAPEVLTGESPPSYASDVYSFAMCVYEAVTLSPPWAGVADVVLRRSVKKGLLPRRPDGAFSDDQWQLLADMAALKPEDRLSMDQVVDQLRAFRTAEFNRHHSAPGHAASAAPPPVLEQIAEEPDNNECDGDIDGDETGSSSAAPTDLETSGPLAPFTPDQVELDGA